LRQVASAQQRQQYRAEQRAAIVSAFERYNPQAMIVFDVDIGHTDPQWVLPYGGTITVDGPRRRIQVQY
jgi:muramoyltetrapeptide carboxypeptidase LdcA involved in peptidoglycan recycling